MAELVFRYGTAGDETVRVNITPRLAWGICYCAVMREMHGRKIDGMKVNGGVKVRDDHAVGVVPVDGSLHVSIEKQDGTHRICARHGSGKSETTLPLSDDKLRKLIDYALEFGPQNKATLAKFITHTPENEFPRVLMTQQVIQEKGAVARTVMFGDDACW